MSNRPLEVTQPEIAMRLAEQFYCVAKEGNKGARWAGGPDPLGLFPERPKPQHGWTKQKSNRVFSQPQGPTPHRSRNDES